MYLLYIILLNKANINNYNSIFKTKIHMITFINLSFLKAMNINKDIKAESKKL